MNKLKTLFNKVALASLIIIFSFISTVVLADEMVSPPQSILEMAQKLAYPDFPKVQDILAIICIESRFNPHAVNKSYNKEEARQHNGKRTKPSRGLMQVQGGSFSPMANMIQGTQKLREYYLLVGSMKGAVISYNIGPGNFLKHRVHISGEKYWRKFVISRRQYTTYLQTVDIE